MTCLYIYDIIYVYWPYIIPATARFRRGDTRHQGTAHATQQGVSCIAKNDER